MFSHSPAKLFICSEPGSTSGTEAASATSKSTQDVLMGPRSLLAALQDKNNTKLSRQGKSFRFVRQKLCQLAVENLAEKALLGQHLFRVSLACSRAKL